MDVREVVKLYYRDRSLSVEALIDTGATTLIIPKSVADELGAEVLGEIDVELADGTVKRWAMELWRLSSVVGGLQLSQL